MIAALVALLAVATAVVARRDRRRVRARVVSPLRGSCGSRVRPGPRLVTAVRDLLAWLGRPVADQLAARLGRLGVDARFDPVLTGGVTATALAMLAVAPALVVPVLVAPVVVTRARTRRRRQRVDQALAAELPFVVELFRLALGAGLSVHHAVPAVAARAPGHLRPALDAVVARERLGEPLADALARLLDLGPGLRPMTLALVAAERDGAPAGAGLERAASEARVAHRRRAEESARRLPVQLLFPLVGCILPAFGLLTVVPLLVASVPHLA